MSHVFISYDHTDGDFVELLHGKLEAAGFEIWVDNTGLKAGQDWRSGIDEAISASQAVILIMSPESLNSLYVTYEWAYALGCKKTLIPLMYRQANLHARLSSLQYLDFTQRSLRPWENLVQRLKEIP